MAATNDDDDNNVAFSSSRSYEKRYNQVKNRAFPEQYLLEQYLQQIYTQKEDYITDTPALLRLIDKVIRTHEWVMHQYIGETDRLNIVDLRFISILMYRSLPQIYNQQRVLIEPTQLEKQEDHESNIDFVYALIRIMCDNSSKKNLSLVFEDHITNEKNIDLIFSNCLNYMIKTYAKTLEELTIEINNIVKSPFLSIILDIIRYHLSPTLKHLSIGIPLSAHNFTNSLRQFVNLEQFEFSLFTDDINDSVDGPLILSPSVNKIWINVKTFQYDDLDTYFSRLHRQNEITISTRISDRSLGRTHSFDIIPNLINVLKSKTEVLRLEILTETTKFLFESSNYKDVLNYYKNPHK